MMIGLRSKKSFLKLFAIVFAFFSWIYVLSSAEIQVEKSVKLQYILPTGMAISSSPINEVHYTLSGPRAFIRNLLSREDIIKIDLRSKYRRKQKVYEINMQSFNLELPFGVNSVGVEPRKIRLELSPLLIKEVKVTANFVGDIADDHKLIEKSIAPSKITLKGPQELLAYVKEIETTPIDLQAMTGKGVKSIPLVPIDPRIQMSHSQISFNYDIKPTRANMILRKIPVRFLSSKMIKSVNRRFVTLMVLADKGSEAKLSASDVKVIAEIPEKSRGVVQVPLRAELPDGVHLLEISPDVVKIVIED